MNYLFSVIVPFQNWNKDLDKLLSALEKQRFKNFELILVSDSEININNTFSFNYKLLICPDLPSKKRNLAAKKSLGKFLSFIDDDAYPNDDWLQNASISILKNNFLCFGGPGLLPKNSTFFEKSAQCYFENKFFNSFSERYSIEKSKFVEEWPTMNFFIDRKIFIKYGMFNETFWPGEDSELCIRLKKNNLEIFYDSNLKVFHRPRSNIVTLSRQTFRYGLHRLYLLKKNFNKSSFIFLLPLINIILVTLLLFLYVLYNSKLIYFYSFIASIIVLISFIKLRSKNKIYNFLHYSFSLVLLLTIHLSYSLGVLKGIISNKQKSRRTR